MTIFSFNSQVQSQTLTQATGGLNISADSTGGSYRVLTGPVITETSPGQIVLGFIKLLAPSGYDWNTAVTPSVVVELAPGLNGVTKLQANFISISTDTITVQVTQTSDNGGNRAGRITFSNLQIRPSTGVLPNEGNITNVGSSAPAGTANYGTVSMVAGAPASVSVETESDGSGTTIASQNLTAGDNLNVFAISRDQFGNFLGNIAADSWQINSASGNVDLSDLTVSGDSKSAAFSSDLVGSGIIQANVTGLTAVPTGTITVVHDLAASLEIVTQPSTSATAGVSFSQQPVIRITDIYGNTTTSDNSTQITVSRKLGSGILQGTKTKTVVGGVATFTNLSHTVANNITLQFSSLGFTSVISNEITVSPGPSTSLIFSVQPPNGSKNVALVPNPRVQIVDDYNNAVADSGITINMTGFSDPNLFANNAVTTAVTGSSGEAVFDKIIVKSNGTYTLQAADAGSLYSSVVSESFNIVSAGALANFQIEASGGGNIADTTAGSTFDITIKAVDGAGNILDGLGNNEFTGKAYLSAGGNTGVGLNDSTANFSGGTLTMSVSLETSGSFSLNASRLLISTSSNTFNIKPAAPSALTSTIGVVPKSIVANGSSTALITATLLDAYGNSITTGGDAVVMTTTSGTLQGSVTDNNDGSYQQFIQSPTLVDTAFISATLDAIAFTNSDTLVFVPGGLNKFIIEAAGGGSIATQTAGTGFDIQIKASDQFGNRVTSFNGSVNLTTNKITTSGTGTLSLSSGLLQNHTMTITESGIGDVRISVINTAGSQTGQSNLFTVNPAALDVANSLITPTNRFIENTGVSTTTITLQARDQYSNNLVSGGETVVLNTTAGTLLGSVSDNANGTYTQTLQSSLTIQQAIITGTINGNPLTDDARVFFTEFNEWTSSGGGGSNPINWSRSSNWTLGTPTSTQAVVIPSNPTLASKFPILDVSPNVAFLEIQNGASLNAEPGFTLTIENDISGSGTLIANSTNITVGGDITISNLNAGSSTVILNGTDQQNITGSVVSDSLIIQNTSAPVVVSGYINAGTALDIRPSTTLSLLSGSLKEIYGDIIGSGTLIASNASIVIGGDVTLTNANFSTSSVTLNGTSAQTISPSFTFNNLSVSNPSIAGVIFSSNVTVNNLLTLSSATSAQFNGNLATSSLTGSGASLGIGGNLSATTINSAPSLVEFNGSGNQYINNFSGFNGLTVNKPSGDLISSVDLSVSGSLTLTSGDLVIGSGKSLLAPTRSISGGQLRFLREFTTSGWHMISSPVNATYGNWLDSLTTQGYTGSTLGNAAIDSLQPNVLYYDETFEGTDLQRWRAPASAADNVIEGRGYFLYVFGDQPGDSRYTNVLPDTLDVGGAEFTGSGTTVDFGVTYTAAADTGWNLLGNPYGATIDWDDAANWTKTNMDNTIYIWDKTANGGNGEYLVWNGLIGSLGDGTIKPFQGFWVKANAASPSLILSQDVKTSGGTFYKNQSSQLQNSLEAMAEAPRLSLKLEGMGMEKRAFLLFSEEASIGKDPFDAYHLQPFTENYLELFSAYEGGDPLLINHLPRRFGKEIEIPLFINAIYEESNVSGDLKLSLDSLAFVPDSWDILLEEISTGNRINLREESMDFFYQNPNARQKRKSPFSSVGAQVNSKAAFKIILQPGEDSGDLPDTFELYSNYPNPFNPQTTIRFDLPVQSRVNLSVFDILGRKVTTLVDGEITAGSHDVLWNPRSMASGVYIYRLMTPEGSFIKKMTFIK